MNLQQIKLDCDNDVMICKATWHKVLNAALYMQAALETVGNTHHAVICMGALEVVEDM